MCVNVPCEMEGDCRHFRKRMSDSNVYSRIMVLVSRLKKSLVKDEDIRHAVEMADLNL